MDQKSPAAVEPRAYSIDSLVTMGFGSRSFLYEQISTGRLLAKKSGRRTLVLASALDDYCRSLPDAREEFDRSR
jgi:hypothetical protein